MKKILLLATLTVGSFLLKPAHAQVSVNVNIGSQPLWGPVGYDYADNYYLPDIETYYSVSRREFIYFDRGRWIYSPMLPGRWSNYDLYSGFKVVINTPNPYYFFNDHRRRYAPYRSYGPQIVIRDSRDRRYCDIPGHPYFRSYSRSDNWDRGNGYDRRDNRNDQRYSNRGRDNRRDDRGGYGSRDNRRDDKNDRNSRGRRW
ncbi:MAG: hypothetical protein H7Y27_03500 [Gemmatimonadaceae bacterium]|nr:hypothetical protein [Chitinophagaceae bacterium]